MLLNNIEIFLKKKQPKSVNMVMGYIFLGICINFTNNRTNAVAENLKTLKIFPFYAKYTILWQKMQKLWVNLTKFKLRKKPIPRHSTKANVKSFWWNSFYLAHETQRSSRFICLISRSWYEQLSESFGFIYHILKLLILDDMISIRHWFDFDYPSKIQPKQIGHYIPQI